MKTKYTIIFILLFFSFNLFAQNKVMIVWYGMGKGHLIPAQRIGEQVKAAYQKRSQSVEVKFVDMRDFTIYDQITEERGKLKYLDWASKEADSYSQYFEFYLEKEPQNIKSNFDLYQLSKFLIKEKPTSIITVFWGAAHTFYLLKLLYPETFKIPVSLLYTDYGVRKFVFMAPTIDKVFLGSKLMYEDTFKKYPAMTPYRSNIDFSGIPVNFNVMNDLKKQNIKSLKKSLGLNPNASVITIARGGEVFLPVSSLIEKIVESFANHPQPIQVILMAGKTQKDKTELDFLQKKYQEKVKIIGFIENEKYLAYLRASNIFVTKPGGASLTEAGLSEIPIIIIPGLGGQENDNQTQFVSNGLAFFEKEENNVVQRIKMILNDPNISRNMIEKQRKFFEGYNTAKIAEWAFNNNVQSDWNKFALEIEQKEKKVAMQEKIALDAISLKNWFSMLNEVALSDLSKDRSFQKIFQDKAQLYMQKAIGKNQAAIERYKKYINDHPGPPNRDLYTKKWKLFRAIILDHSFHINLHQTYTPPDRALLDQLTNELLQFLNTDIFAKDLGVYSVWEFSRGALHTFLANFYYLSRFYPKAQEHLDLALKEYPLDNTNESLIQIQADIFLRLKKPQKAIDFLKFYLQKNPDMDFVRANLANILNDENRQKEAEEQCRELIMSHSNTITMKDVFVIATIYVKNGKKSEALNILLKGVEKYGDKSLPLTSLSIRLLNSNEDLKKGNEKLLADLIAKYKFQVDWSLKRIETLPLIVDEQPLSGKEGFFGM